MKKKFWLYLLLIFQLSVLLLLVTFGLLLYLVIINAVLCYMEPHDYSAILFLFILGVIYIAAIIFTIVSIFSTKKLIKNSPLSIFNKISFIVFALTVIFICWLLYTPKQTSVDRRFLKVYHTTSYFYSGVNLRRV